MAFTYGAGLAAGGDQQEARKVVVSGKRDDQSSKHSLSQAQDTLRAELAGDSFCSIGDIVASGRTPVLALCRSLLAAGLDPDAALHVFRGATLALKVRSIREGAVLTVSEETNRSPRFKPWKPLDLGDGSATARQSQNSMLSVMEQAE
jgi:hypothetical protein